MESSIRAFRRNLEPFENDRAAPPWHVAGHTDLVSEKRYLVSWAPLDTTRRAGLSVFQFQCEAAMAIAPDGCDPVLELAAQDGRVEVLTAYAAPLESCARDDEMVLRVLDQIATTLAQFDAHAFHATALQPGLTGISDDGRAVILPGAYLLPALSDAHRGVTPARAAREARAAHLAGFVEIARVLAGRASETLGRTLRNLSRDVQTHAVTCARDAMALVRGETPAIIDALPAPEHALQSAAIMQALANGQVVEITGAAGTGKTTVLVDLLGELRARGHTCRWIDEWDVTATQKRKGGSRDSEKRGD